MSLMFFLWICLFIPNVPHSFQPIDVSHIQKFMVQKPLIKGCLRGDLQSRVLTFWGGLLIRCWHYIYNIYMYIYWYSFCFWCTCYLFPYISLHKCVLQGNATCFHNLCKTVTVRALCAQLQPARCKHRQNNERSGSAESGSFHLSIC